MSTIQHWAGVFLNGPNEPKKVATSGLNKGGILRLKLLSKLTSIYLEY